jgi:hypothetical protein
MYNGKLICITGGILYYPHFLNIWATRLENHFKCIEQALAEGWSFLGTIGIKNNLVDKNAAVHFGAAC